MNIENYFDSDYKKLINQTNEKQKRFLKDFSEFLKTQNNNKYTYSFSEVSHPLINAKFHADIVVRKNNYQKILDLKFVNEKEKFVIEIDVKETAVNNINISHSVLSQEWDSTFYTPRNKYYLSTFSGVDYLVFIYEMEIEWQITLIHIPSLREVLEKEKIKSYSPPYLKNIIIEIDRDFIEKNRIKSVDITIPKTEGK
jgi:hypothetical protein